MNSIVADGGLAGLTGASVLAVERQAGVRGVVQLGGGRQDAAAAYEPVIGCPDQGDRLRHRYQSATETAR